MEVGRVRVALMQQGGLESRLIRVAGRLLQRAVHGKGLNPPRTPLFSAEAIPQNKKERKQPKPDVPSHPFLPRAPPFCIPLFQVEPMSRGYDPPSPPPRFLHPHYFE